MSRLRVESTVDAYEVDGMETSGVDISIKSHWNQRDMVLIQIPDIEHRTGIIVAVSASDLKKAIENATNA